MNLDRFYNAKKLDPMETRAKLRLPLDRIIVTIVGRLQRWKGMHTFLDAIALIRESHPDVLGVIVGGKHDLEPDYPELLASNVSSLRIEPWIRFTASQKNVPEWMQASDIIVHASEREPFGIVVIEAMSLGKPVIATRPGGPEEMITDGIDGLLIPHGDSHALSEAIQRFINDRDFASRCAAAAQVRAKDFAGADYPLRVVAAPQSIASVRLIARVERCKSYATGRYGDCSRRIGFGL